jgi:hypothetical protein
MMKMSGNDRGPGKEKESNVGGVFQIIYTRLVWLGPAGPKRSAYNGGILPIEEKKNIESATFCQAG